MQLVTAEHGFDPGSFCFRSTGFSRAGPLGQQLQVFHLTSETADTGCLQFFHNYICPRTLYSLLGWKDALDLSKVYSWSLQKSIWHFIVLTMVDIIPTSTTNLSRFSDSISSFHPRNLHIFVSCLFLSTFCFWDLSMLVHIDSDIFKFILIILFCRFF